MSLWHSIRVSSHTLPFNIGTLKSTRTSTRFPVTSTSSSVRNSITVFSFSLSFKPSSSLQRALLLSHYPLALGIQPSQYSFIFYHSVFSKTIFSDALLKNTRFLFFLHKILFLLCNKKG
ncbi:protein of unknown function [Bartonella clarridgeiae 73]|uniref:Uncharacterized protein n=1 Tax=Bartonella clarridgeiae (strain CCUG 45776 / CIP 104772 / 73) TaxID=696125 RepID=E6YJ75_BARC7|nr:protein of unknown function [Bartonella clarridgeiae 73]